MGYDLHITRREDLADSETPDISFEEWLTYVDNDKELELTNGYDIKIGLEQEFQNIPGFCEWNAHPTEKAIHSRPWFSYWEGSIYTKNPDDATIQKMILIASALNAKVRGDDGEIYTEGYLTELESIEEPKSIPQSVSQKPWWQFW